MAAFDTTPPHNREAEQALLGCILMKPAIIDESLELVGSNNFYSEPHKIVYQTIADMRADGTEIDTISVADVLESKDLLERCGGKAYLLDLMGTTSIPSVWKRYAEIVRRKAIMRRLIDVGTRVTAIGYDDVDEDYALSEVQSLVMGVVLANQQESLSVDTVLTDLWKSINEGGQPYITPEGVPLARIRPGDLVVVGAGTSAGKTAITLNWCDDWAKKHKVAYFEYEMTEQDLMSRLVCKHAGVSTNQIQDCDFTPEELERVRDSMKELRSRKLDIEEVWCDVGILMAKIRRAAMAGTEVVVIDHLGLVPFNRNKGMSEAKAIGVMVTNPLKRLASELGIKIVLLVQMNREGQKSDSFPKLYHLRDSGEIEQDAAIVLMLWSDKGLLGDEGTRGRIREASGVIPECDLFSEDYNLIRIGVEKNRNGALGHQWAKFTGNRFSYEYLNSDGSSSSDKPLF
jgi:replicative DNA helicase